MSRIRADKFVNRAASGAPELTYGAQVVTGYGITGAGGINITGVATATSFSGSGANLTGIAATANVVTNSLVSSGIVTVSNTTDSTSSITGALVVSGGVGIAKSLFVGNNVTIGGTVTYEDVTNVDSVGLITAQTGIKVTAGGIDIAGGGIEVAGITTLATDIRIGTGASVFQPSSNTLTVGTASTEILRLNANNGIIMNNGLLTERVKIDSDSINSDKFIRLQDGMVHYRTSAVGAASVKPDIVSTTGINTDLAIGDAIAVTLITTAGNTSHFVSSVAIDGRTTGITTYWVGGETPTDGGGSNIDTYTFNILKTADNTFTVVANQVKTS